jgi:hypothetical protein
MENYVTKTDLAEFEERFEKKMASMIGKMINDAVSSLTASLTVIFEKILDIMVTKDEFNEFKKNTEHSFYEINTKLKDHDRRFDTVDRRLEKVDTMISLHSRENRNFNLRFEKLEKHTGLKKGSI